MKDVFTTRAEALEALLAEPEDDDDDDDGDDVHDDDDDDTAPADAAEWLPLDRLILAREPSPPRAWSGRTPVLIGFDAASVARLFPTLDRVIIGRTGSDRPRGCRSEIGLRLDVNEWFFPCDDDAKMPAKFRLPRSRFRQCHGSCGAVAEYGFPPAEQQVVAVFPME
jgi:hypothetical protein